MKEIRWRPWFLPHLAIAAAGIVVILHVRDIAGTQGTRAGLPDGLSVMVDFFFQFVGPVLLFAMLLLVIMFALGDRIVYQYPTIALYPVFIKKARRNIDVRTLSSVEFVYRNPNPGAAARSIFRRELPALGLTLKNQGASEEAEEFLFMPMFADNAAARALADEINADIRRGR